MAIYLVENQEIRPIDPPLSLDGIRQLLACRFVERIPGVETYDGELADMYGDEEAGINARPFNHRAVDLRDAALVASGHRPSPNPVQGPVIIVTGVHRLP